MSKFSFRFSMVPFVLTGVAMIPASGQLGPMRSWDSVEERHSLLFPVDPDAAPQLDRFPRTADGESKLSMDALAPRGNAPLGTARGKISAQALQRPPSKKESKLLRQVQELAESGDHAKAIEILRAALPGASGYIHSRLGTEYLKTGRPDLAIPELEEAVHLMPGESAHHSNLSYAYRLTRRLPEAEREARTALELDHSSGQAHFLLGAILLGRKGDPGEAVDHLKLARAEVRSARFALAQFYAISGMADASRRELASFLEEAQPVEREIAERWFAEHGFKPASAP